MYSKFSIILCLCLFIVSCGKTVEKSSLDVIQVTEKNREIITSSEQLVNKKDKMELPQEITPEENNCVIFDDFSGLQKNNWYIVNDGVMGGLSKGRYTIDNNVLTLFGNVNTNGGGFTSIRSSISDGLMNKTHYIQLSVKGDSRDYKITFRDNNMRRIGHQAKINFKNRGTFEDIIIPISDLKGSYFGRNVNANSLSKNNVREIGFIISDGIDGPFSLEIESIKFCEKDS